jgi:acetyl-CoA acetyltransferase
MEGKGTMVGRAAIVGYAEYAATKRGGAAPARNSLEMAADLASLALADAGMTLSEVDGVTVAGIHEAGMFAPSAVVEYLGLRAAYVDAPDLGGATPAAMVSRAAMAIQAGQARTVLCLTPGAARHAGDPLIHEVARYGTSSYRPGSPQAEFEIPFGHLGQNGPYALIAQRYAYEHGYDERALARLVAHQRASANRTPGAIFEHQVVTEQDVLASRMIASPLRLLEIVMPVEGGAALLVAAADRARNTPHRPVWITGYGECVAWKSPYYAPDLLHPPLTEAAAQAFAMASRRPADMDMAQIYDCYSITVLMALEAAGFCGKGEGMAFLRAHDMRWCGDFPVNTNGGQLGYGQAGAAGGMCHLVEAARQIMGRAGARAVRRADRALVVGNGGIMSEQVAIVLEGD